MCLVSCVTGQVPHSTFSDRMDYADWTLSLRQAAQDFEPVWRTEIWMSKPGATESDVERRAQAVFEALDADIDI